MPPVNSQLGYQNFLSGKLTADVTNVATDIFIDTIPSVSQGFLVIDPFTPASREVIFFTSKTASKVSVPAVGGRGVNGTPLPHFNGTTYVMSAIAEMFAALQNGSASTDPLRTDIFYDFILSGGVVALSAGLIGTFANIIFWQNGVRYSGSSIASKTYTASKDTYVDILGNSDGTVTVTYTEVANNAASPALSAGYTRVAIVTTSGAAITNVNQGQETQTIPVASSRPYVTTDSLGNLICPRDPFRTTLGNQQYGAGNLSTASGTFVQLAALVCPVIVPNNGRKVKFTISASAINANSSGVWAVALYEDGVILQQWYRNQDTATGNNIPLNVTFKKTPTPGAHTYDVRLLTAGGTVTISVGTVGAAAFTAGPIALIVEQA